MTKKLASVFALWLSTTLFYIPLKSIECSRSVQLLSAHYLCALLKGL